MDYDDNKILGTTENLFQFSILFFQKKKNSIPFQVENKKRNFGFFFQVGTFSLAHDRQMVLGCGATSTEMAKKFNQLAVHFC